MTAAALLLALAAQPDPSGAVEAARRVAARPGDTPAKVAARERAAPGAVAAANRIAAARPIAPGTTLTIPAGRTHRVAAGEQGLAIARAYGVPWAAIVRANGLTPPYGLREGQRLLIPLAKPAAVAAGRAIADDALEARARAFRLDADAPARGGAEPPARAASAAARRPEAEKPAAPRKPAAPPVRTAVAPSGDAAPTKPPTKPTPATANTPGAVAATGAAPRFAWPVAGGRVVRPFGVLPGGGRSQGIDLAVPAGTAVTAGADGVVAYADTYAGFGRVVLLRHGPGWLSLYARVGALVAERGQRVTRGQLIARTGPAPLHFEVRQGKAAVDPTRLLPAR